MTLPSLLALIALGAATACAPAHTASLIQDQPYRDWEATLSGARALAEKGQTSAADSALARYAATYPSAPQAVEVGYWRALLNFEAPVEMQSTTFAIPLLQSYVAAGRSTEHWIEADALLRMAARVDSLSHLTATYVTHGEVTLDATKIDTKTPPPDARDDEIKRLKDELAKSKDELDRIKKRLAEPPKKPPVE